MLSFNTAAPLRPFLALADLAAAWAPSQHLNKSLASLSDEELDRILISAGRTRGDLFTVFEGNAKHRQRLARMIEHYSVNLEHATRHYWEALRRADQDCATCANTKRCRNWCGWGVKNDAPRIFCPHAALFDEMARTALDSEAA